jgi:hypothetical protein
MATISFLKTNDPWKRPQTYDEANTKAKAVKRRRSESRIEIQYSGITVEIE